MYIVPYILIICISIQRDATMGSIYYLFHCRFTLHVSGSIYAHHQAIISHTFQPIVTYDLYQWSTTSAFCTPDEGCKWHPKDVEEICSEIKNIYCALLHLVGYLYIL
jgi:hypothetical protein